MAESMDGLLDVGWVPRSLPTQPLAWVSVADPHMGRTNVKVQRRADLRAAQPPPRPKPPKQPRALRAKDKAAAQSNENSSASNSEGPSGRTATGSPAPCQPVQTSISTTSLAAPVSKSSGASESVAYLMKSEEKDARIHWLPREVETGNIEYKYRLCSPNPMRTQQLITQMRFRLSQGGGVCFYYLGVEDDGYPKGLSHDDLDASIATLQSMARSLEASGTLVRHLAGAHGRHAALMRVAWGTAEEATWTDLRIAVSGCLDAGKSTLVAVLTHGAEGFPMLETGRGTARMSVFQHKHEIESGRTSSLSQQLLGYDREGHVLNYAGQQESYGADVCVGASKVLTLIDMGGHERFMKTALYGMTALLPDYSLLCCCAVRGLAPVSREHLAAALALEIPASVVITKVDMVDAAQLENTIQDIRALLATALPYLQPSLPPQASHENTKRGTAEQGPTHWHAQTVSQAHTECCIAEENSVLSRAAAMQQGAQGSSQSCAHDGVGAATWGGVLGAPGGAKAAGAAAAAGVGAHGAADAAEDARSPAAGGREGGEGGELDVVSLAPMVGSEEEAKRVACQIAAQVASSRAARVGAPKEMVGYGGVHQQPLHYHQQHQQQEQHSLQTTQQQQQQQQLCSCHQQPLSQEPHKQHQESLQEQLSHPAPQQQQQHHHHHHHHGQQHQHCRELDHQHHHQQQHHYHHQQQQQQQQQHGSTSNEQHGQVEALHGGALPSGTATATTTTAATSTCTCVSGSNSSTCNSSGSSSRRSSEDGHPPIHYPTNNTTDSGTRGRREDCQRPPLAQSPAPHIIPIFAVSAVTGAGLPVLHAFLQTLQPTRTPNATGADSCSSNSATTTTKSSCSAAALASGERQVLEQDNTAHAARFTSDTAMLPSGNCGVGTGGENGTTELHSHSTVGGDASGGITATAGNSTAGPSAISKNGTFQGPCYSNGSRGSLQASPPATSQAEAVARDSGVGGSLNADYGPGKYGLHTTDGQPAARIHFQVSHTYDVEGVGSVVSGTVLQGCVCVGQQLKIGPDVQGGFVDVEVSGVKRGHIPVRLARAGQTATLALQPLWGTPPGALGTHQRHQQHHHYHPHHHHHHHHQQQAGSSPTSQLPLPACETQHQCHCPHEQSQPPLLQQVSPHGQHTVVSITASPPHTGSTSGAHGNAPAPSAAPEMEASAAAGKKASSAGPRGGPVGVGAPEKGTSAESAAAEAKSGREEEGIAAGHGATAEAGAVDVDNLAPDLLELFDMEDEGEDCGDGGGNDEDNDLWGSSSHEVKRGAMNGRDRRGQEGGATSGGIGAHRGVGSKGDGGSGVACESACAAGALSDSGQRGGDPEGWLGHELEWEECRLATSPVAPTFLARSPPSSRKGAVLLDAACVPLTSWGFEAVLVLFGGQWPPRGLLSGRWPPMCDEQNPTSLPPPAPATAAADAAATSPQAHSNGGSAASPQAHSNVGSAAAAAVSQQAHSHGGSAAAAAVSQQAHSNGGGASQSGRGSSTQPWSHARASRSNKGQYSVMVHCASIRQLARLVCLQEEAALPRAAACNVSSSHTTGLSLPAGMKAAAALVATCGGRSVGGSSNGDSGADGGPEEEEGCCLGGGAVPTGTARRKRTGHGGRSRGGSQQDVGCIATATFRFVHRSEWLCEGAPLIVRDRSDGRLSGAGFVRRIFPGQPLQ